MAGIVPRAKVPKIVYPRIADGIREIKEGDSDTTIRALADTI
jgi:hypothetical protein